MDAALRRDLARLGFTGRIGERWRRGSAGAVDPQLADIGRQLWFDPIQGLNNDNTCAGCHSPTNGFGDTQPIAIGIDNNGIVGPGRDGPAQPAPNADDDQHRVLPDADVELALPRAVGRPVRQQPRVRVSAARRADALRLSRICSSLRRSFRRPSGSRRPASTFPVATTTSAPRCVRRLNATTNYRSLFARAFSHVKAGGADHVRRCSARAIAEFEFTQVYADAPIDRYARGDRNAMTASQKRGAVLFFGKAGCVSCHAVSGASNEMFSDFQQHVAGVPQVAPSFGNVTFDGPGANEDFGLEQVTGNPADRYAFRTSPLRNVALQPAFMHNGAFVHARGRDPVPS